MNLVGTRNMMTQRQRYSKTKTGYVWLLQLEEHLLSLSVVKCNGLIHIESFVSLPSGPGAVGLCPFSGLDMDRIGLIYSTNVSLLLDVRYRVCASCLFHWVSNRTSHHQRQIRRNQCSGIEGLDSYKWAIYVWAFMGFRDSSPNNNP